MEIDTYGNVDSLYYVMQGVASFMGSGTWTGLIRYTLLCGVVIWTIVAIGRKGTEIFRWFAGAMLMTQLLLAPVENVFISDVNNVQPTREVDHVPVFLAALAQGFTPISRVLTQAYETVFSVPDSLTLRKGDVGFGISVLKKVNQAEITDPGLHADLMQFFKECTVYDIQDGAIDPKTIMNGTDPFNTVFTSTSPARYVTTNTLTANPTTDTCTATGTLLLIRVQDAEQSAEQIYGSEMYPEISDPGMAKAAFVNAIGDSYGFILQSSQNASSALRQAMFNNVWRQAGAELPAMLNDPARVAEVNALMSSAQAAVATNGSLASVAILAKDTLPTVRNYAEAVIYAVCPLVLIMCLVSGGDAAKKILAMYGKTIGWVSLWPVLFAMINGLSMIRLSHVMHSMSLQNGVPFGMAAKFGSTLIDEQALLGYMVIIVPVLAWGILNVASAGLNGAFGMLSRAVTGPAEQIGGQQAQGNESIGNVHMDSSSIDSASRNVTSANKFDNTVQSRTGSMNVDTGTGSAFTNFSNGLIARTDYQNSLGVSATSQQAFERSLGTDSSTGVSANQTSSAFSGREQVASGTTSVSNSQERGTTQRVADDSTSGTRGSTTQSGDRRTSVDRQYGLELGHSIEGQTSWGGRGSLSLGGSLEKSFGDEPGAVGGAGGGGKDGAGGAGRRSAGNESQGAAGNNSPVFSQAEEDRLASKAESLGKSPQEVQSVRDGYRKSVRAIDYATGGGTGRGRAAGNLGASLGLDAGYTKNYRNTSSERFVDQYGSSGTFSENDQYSSEGSQIHSDSTGMDSGQHARAERTASLTDQVSSGSRVAVDLSRSADLRQRGSSQEVSRVDTSTNLMTPENLQKVAARNGMRYSQLMTLSADDLARLVSEDASMRDIVSRNSTLPTNARDGTALPANRADVVRQSRLDRSSVGAGVTAAYHGFSGAVGPADTSALNVSTPMPEVVSGAQQRVDAMRQRVSTDAAVPIKQVSGNVDLPSDNKSLMDADQAPGRPLPSSFPPSPASAQASDSSGSALLDGWRNDILPQRANSAGAASSPAVERFLHPEAPSTGNSVADGRTGMLETSSASSAARLSESDFRVVALDASDGSRSERPSRYAQHGAAAASGVGSLPMRPMTAKPVNFGGPVAIAPLPPEGLTGTTGITGHPGAPADLGVLRSSGVPGLPIDPDGTPIGKRSLAPALPSSSAVQKSVADRNESPSTARERGLSSASSDNRNVRAMPAEGTAGAMSWPEGPVEQPEPRPTDSGQTMAPRDQVAGSSPATSPSALPSSREGKRGAGKSEREQMAARNPDGQANESVDK
ncbi:conjugal transfer protein TraG N-terminal domain-containing protein [Burkholderia gladioli]|uniref:conjugal transfer protein TraG N-terminal domain-containing protein n=1 Tax=Burkholderia gladioli TaxID=28095 RepID=UPI0021530E89|nr:conjugal transfer protein TraG N-terminal domain-containing protein [Burkholderia gladioli]